MNGAITEGVGERVVDEPVLLDEREPVEALARDHDLEVIAATRSIVDRKVRIRKSLREQSPKPVD